MKNAKITICDAVVQPGEVANLAMPLPERYSCSPLYMPIKVINGKEKGPCVLIFSTLKGNELNGLEIANRICEKLDPNTIKGTIISVPVLNIYGLTQAGISNTKSLENSFPGLEDGTFSQRIAHLFTQEVLKKADYCIELQTGGLNHNILPQVYCNFDDAESKNLARAFQSPVITSVRLDTSKLRQTTEDLQIPLLVYQAGEAMRFDENAIQLGVDGIVNVLRAVDVLEKAPVREFNPIFSQEEDWIVAHKAGILYTDVSLGQIIKKDDIIGRIKDPFGVDAPENVLSPQEGIVVGINTTPLIHEGTQLFNLASFVDNDKAENVIGEWDKKQPDSYID